MYFYFEQSQQQPNKLIIQIWNTNIFFSRSSLVQLKAYDGWTGQQFRFPTIYLTIRFCAFIAVINLWDCEKRQKAIEMERERENTTIKLVLTVFIHFTPQIHIWNFKLQINNMRMIRFPINMLRFLLSFTFSFARDYKTVNF